MAFVKKVGGTYWWPGTIRVPSEDGTLEEFEIKLQFKRVGFKETKAFENDTELLKNIVVGWSGIQDETGKELAFSKKELADLLNDQFVAIGFAQTYFDALQKARTGN